MKDTTNVKAYPLAWPKARPRTKVSQQSRFGEKSVAIAFTMLKRELQRLGAGGIVVSTNIPLKPNGEPYSEKTKLPDPGVAVYFRLKIPYCLSCDRWNYVEDNIHAIAKHIEAMRGMERWGVASIEESFAGFKMLASGPAWYEVLGVPQFALMSTVEARYKELAKKAHPDTGGSAERMAELNAARDAAREEQRRGVNS